MLKELLLLKLMCLNEATIRDSLYYFYQTYHAVKTNFSNLVPFSFPKSKQKLCRWKSAYFEYAKVEEYCNKLLN